MTALDTALRDMLHERAADIAAVPALDTSGRRSSARPLLDVTESRARTPWLVAASAAAVLLVGAGTLAVGLRGQSHHPGGGVPVEREPGPRTDINLDWFGLQPVSGYTATLRESDPGMRVIVLHKAGSTQPARGGHGSSLQSVQITVLDRGRYHPTATGILHGTTTTLAGIGTVRSGRTPRIVPATQSNTSPTITPTLAWEYAANAWAVAQSLTTDADADLARVAQAVRPLDRVPITVPFRLARAPEQPLTALVDSRGHRQRIEVHFGTPSSRDRIGVAPSDIPRPKPGQRLGTGRPAGALTGFDGTVLPFHDGVVTFTLYHLDGTLLDAAETRQITSGVSFSGGNGTGTGVPLREAIPRS